ncbi:sensor histidine kinase [Larkinella sp. VNQ87]|uniref:sensor histidine kinase n=1 Tax=Larkinella sp. VNQ87 TaxID=3400921 RepID=UPI003C070483
MSYTDAALFRDIERIKQIPIIPTILDVICQTTGMGFAAVARVTEKRWITCSVRDDIQFGLMPGDELEIETTICNEIRTRQQPVIIDHVREDSVYCQHHTPRMYGFQSYISFPIFQKNGEFFGTLCAIDPHPHALNNARVIGLFSLFTDLIAFHLQQVDLLDHSLGVVQRLDHQLANTLNENRQYRRMSSHNLQEPLRKLRIFSEMLIDASDRKDINQAKHLALKINANARKFSMMIKGLADFVDLEDEESVSEPVDLNKLIRDVSEQLAPQLQAKQAIMEVDDLPPINGIRLQLEQLFYQLVSNAVKFSREDTPPVITISCQLLDSWQLPYPLPAGAAVRYLAIQIADNGIGIEKSQLEKIFDLFMQLPDKQVREGEGFGLAYCRKVIQNHSGLIRAHSEVGEGTTITVTFPLT